MRYIAKIKFLPERWVVEWVDDDGVEYREFFNFKEEALRFKKEMESKK